MRILTICMKCKAMEFIDTTEMLIKEVENNLRYTYISRLEAACESCGAKIIVAEFEEHASRAVDMLIR